MGKERKKGAHWGARKRSREKEKTNRPGDF